MMNENRQYHEMMSAAIHRIKNVAIPEAAKRSGMAYDHASGQLSFQSFGEKIIIDTSTFQATAPIGMWQHLAILQYLEAADGCLPTDNWISMADLSEGGMVRGAGFDREIDNIIADRLGKYLPKHIHAACERLGATFHNDFHADLCADFCFLPFFPLRLNLWFADDEFPASGKLLVNNGVKHCLGTEAIGTVATLLLQKLCKVCLLA